MVIHIQTWPHNCNYPALFRGLKKSVNRLEKILMDLNLEKAKRAKQPEWSPQASPLHPSFSVELA